MSCLSIWLTKSGAVSFGERLANSQSFTDLFRDGMALIEETATYLDGTGRQESRETRTVGVACLCDGKHAAGPLRLIAARVLASPAPGGEGRRDVASPRQYAKSPR